jgi:hypothetical protein
VGRSTHLSCQCDAGSNHSDDTGPDNPDDADHPHDRGTHDSNNSCADDRCPNDAHDACADNRCSDHAHYACAHDGCPNHADYSRTHNGCADDARQYDGFLSKHKI